MFSWKLKQTRLGEEYFYRDIFICECGHTKCIVSKQYQEIDYSCVKCENNYFYDADLAKQTLNLFEERYKDEQIRNDLKITIEEIFSYEYLQYNVKDEKDNLISYAFVLIPHDFDDVCQEIIYYKKVIYSITFSKSGTITEDYETSYNNIVFNKLKKQLEKSLEESKLILDIPDIM